MTCKSHGRDCKAFQGGWLFPSGLGHILVEASGSPGAAAGGGLLPSRTLSPPVGENAWPCFQIHLEYDE